MAKQHKHQNAVELLAISDHLFSKKMELDDLRQEIAREVYPERADFNVERWIGEEFATDLVESTPARYRQELANAMGALVRPSKTKGLWFALYPSEEYGNSHADYQWCDMATRKMFRMWHSRTTGSINAAKISDHDTVSFGDAALSLTRHPKNPMLTWMESHHLADCAWTLDRTGEMQDFHRKFKVPAREFESRGWTLPEEIRRHLDKNPFYETDVRHIVVPAGAYEPMNKRTTKDKPFISIYILPAFKTILEEGGYFTHPYMVRQWMRHRNSQYSYSPAAMLGLIESRLLQTQGRVILDAGERAVDPPIIATQEALLSDPMTYAGAITWVDAEYDEKLGAAMRPLATSGDLPIGLEMRQDTRELLAAIWYINKLTLPSDREMTAYEVGERLSEYIRSIGPIVEPFELHSEVMLTSMFDHMLRYGAFGPIETIPKRLLDQELQFEFEGPIKEAHRRHEAVKARETLEMVGPVAETGDPRARHLLNTEALLRDGIMGIGARPDWVNPAEVVEQRVAQEQKMQEQQMQLEQAGKAAAAAKDAGQAGPGLMNLAQQAQMLQEQQGQGQGDALPDDLNELLQIAAGPADGEGMVDDGQIIDAEFEEADTPDFAAGIDSQQLGETAGA